MKEYVDYTDVCNIVLQAKDMVFTHTMETKTKGQGDFVTNIDLQINAYIKNALNAHYPHIDFFSEEEESTLSDNCWILDPLDGTTNLVYGYNMSAISLAHYCNGHIVFGIVYNPFSEEMFTAQKGRGAYLNHTKQLCVSARPLAQSIIEFGVGSNDRPNAPANFSIGLEVFQKSLDLRRICASALAICYMADARIDGYFERVLQPWDYAAASLILTEAGGKLTDFHAHPLCFDHGTSVIASNGQNYTELYNIIAKHDKSLHQ